MNWIQISVHKMFVICIIIVILINNKYINGLVHKPQNSMSVGYPMCYTLNINQNHHNYMDSRANNYNLYELALVLLDTVIDFEKYHREMYQINQKPIWNFSGTQTG